MPTAKPRITITLEPRQHEVLSRLSAAGGDSMSSIVTQFVDMALPSLERLVVVLERARSATQETRAGLASAVERAERDLIPAIQSTLAMGDLFLMETERALDGRPGPHPKGGAKGARAVRQDRPKGRAKPVPTPVPVTRGSGLRPEGSKGRRNGSL